MKIITRNIRILAFVSLFTDMASEMLYPVMPVYLKQVGFSVLLIGILEGLAETTAGLSKGYFGQWSDHSGRRAPFVRSGYGLSALSKPLLALFTYPLWIFFARTLDRLGKGIRTGARDALLSDETRPETKAQVFGFHRSMDTLGAVLGPALALLYLHGHPGAYRPLFYLAFFPGVLAVACTFLIRERPVAAPVLKTRPGWFDFFRYWPRSRPEYKRLTALLLLFALFNSSDMFLLLKAKDSGLSDTAVIGMYIFYNLVFAAAAWPTGILADRIGVKRVLIAGLLLFAAVYAGLAVARQPGSIFGLFFLYGLYAAATDGISKAWISNICEKENTATAIGAFTAFQSVTAFLASSLTGLVWYLSGPGTALLLSAGATFAVAVCLYFFVKPDT